MAFKEIACDYRRNCLCSLSWSLSGLQQRLTQYDRGKIASTPQWSHTGQKHEPSESHAGCKSTLHNYTTQNDWEVNLDMNAPVPEAENSILISSHISTSTWNAALLYNIEYVWTNLFCKKSCSQKTFFFLLFTEFGASDWDGWMDESRMFKVQRFHIVLVESLMIVVLAENQKRKLVMSQHLISL